MTVLGSNPKVPGVDPLLVWAEATGFADFLSGTNQPPKQLPAIIAIKPTFGVAALDKELKRFGARVTAAYLSSPPGMPALEHCTAMLTPRFLRAYFAAGHATSVVDRFELQLPVIPLRPRPVANTPKAPGAPSAASAASPAPGARTSASRERCGRKSKLLIGVIDSGCAFAHRSLRDGLGKGTRVLNLWDQDLRPPAQWQPAEFAYGREFGRGELNAIMKGATRNGVIDEAACYAAAGFEGLRERDSHGMAVLDLLAGPRPLRDRVELQPGQPPFRSGHSSRGSGDPASAADLVFVNLPLDAVQDSSSASLPRHLLDGIHYILGCAGPSTTHVVINISDGSSRGSHDGGSIIERAFDELVSAQLAKGVQLDIIVAAGNQRQEMRHALWSGLPRNAQREICLRVLPDSEAPSWVVLLLPSASARQVKVTLTPPPNAVPQGRGAVSARAGTVALWPPAAGARAGIVFPASTATSGVQRRLTVLICIAPTALGQTRPAAPSGDWLIGLETRGAVSGEVQAFVPRNGRNVGAMLRGRQAVFVDDAYDIGRYLRSSEEDPLVLTSPICRDGAINGLAAASRVHVAGGVNRRTGEPTPYSSAGVVVAASGKPRRLPDLGFPADETRALVGVRAAGALSGQVVRMRGTSFCAPQFARWLCETTPPAPSKPPRNRSIPRERPATLAGLVSPLQIPPLSVVDVEP